MILEDLEVYRIALEISDLAWDIYNELPREFRFGQGSQFLDAADSVGANIAEGFGRYHYKDSVKFYYNSRGSLLELKHWSVLLKRRSLAELEKVKRMLVLIKTEHIKLNSFISSIKSRTNSM